ncbi:Vascular endothelial growth factor receptor [Balamuthia mandrillaris]
MFLLLMPDLFQATNDKYPSHTRNVTCGLEFSGGDAILLTFLPSAAACRDLGPSAGTRLLECNFENLRHDVSTTRELLARVDPRLRGLDITISCHSDFLNSLSNPVAQQSLRFLHVDAVDGDTPSSSTSSNGAGDGEQQDKNNSESDSNMALPIGLAIGLGVPIVLLLVGLAILLVLLRRRKKRARLERQHEDMNAKEDSMELYATGDLNAVGAASNNARNRTELKNEKDNGSLQWQIPFSELEFDEQIGQGCFGTVWRGTWRETRVAIKMFNSIMDSKTSKANFKAESEIMKNLRPHTNVTQLFGVSMEESTPWCLVTEFLAAGNLLQFLQNLKGKQQAGDEVFKKMAVRMAREIAAGMHHLHSENIVHRDLAARNILLTGDFTVKVADFGLSTLESDEEMAQTIPIRWTPPEFFSKRTFDKKADVWSYGVLLWEIVNFGQMPYSKMTSEQVITAVLNGEVLKLDENAPEVLRSIAAQCFQFDPQQRPSFKDIIKMLKEDKASH